MTSKIPASFRLLDNPVFSLIHLWLAPKRLENKDIWTKARIMRIGAAIVYMALACKEKDFDLNKLKLMWHIEDDLKEVGLKISFTENKVTLEAER